jgi:uncharacterized protein (DUF427 family)
MAGRSAAAAGITIAPNPNRVIVRLGGAVIADTTRALVMRAPGTPDQPYIPREDVDMTRLVRTDLVTHCPYKGDAAYYTLLMDGNFAENAVWTYEQPYPAMTLIEGRLAFYPDKVEVYEVDDAAVNPHHHADVGHSGGVDAIVQQTDAGDGAAQGKHWQPNVERPVVEHPDDSGLR